jgi:hypothetical protein
VSELELVCTDIDIHGVWSVRIAIIRGVPLAVEIRLR